MRMVFTMTEAMKIKSVVMFVACAVVASYGFMS